MDGGVGYHGGGQSGGGASRARLRVLAEWRGVDLEPNEIARRVASKPVGKTLADVLKTLKLDQKRSEAEIVKVWNHLMAPDIAAHAQPISIRKGTLFVAVDNSAWLDEIVRFRQREILQKLQTSFGRQTIMRISFRAG